MLSAIRKLLRPPGPAPEARVPDGERVYAIGDIHGRSDLLEALVEAIERDHAARGPAKSTVVLLGDLIDRGPDSFGVLLWAREWQKLRPVRILMGNHEEMLLGAMEKLDVLKQFVRFGGRETLLSFGLDEELYETAEWEVLHAMAIAATPQSLLEFIRTFEDRVQIGDYLFVHAGIAPGVPIDEQKRSDLRWIREPFLSDENWHGAMVVHGHSITGHADVRANRIGIDTGAYASDVLTAIGLEGTERWLIEARGTRQAVVTETLAA
ncbi:MAG: serine/threonine protein phosphatase [Sphingomonadales bacterium]|nr:serine/threonine protein phosphatase [Sphingomonadales bacterium]